MSSGDHKVVGEEGSSAEVVRSVVLRQLNVNCKGELAQGGGRAIVNAIAVAVAVTVAVALFETVFSR